MSKPKKSKESQLEKPVWLKYTQEEVEAIILKLANKGLTAEKIGLVLRDQYGIPQVSLYNIKIKKILKDKFEDPSDRNLRKRLDRIIVHYKKNKQDKRAERALIITKSKLKKVEEYKERKSR